MAFFSRFSVTVLVFLVLSSFQIATISSDDSLLPVFEKWMKDYGRSYGSPTEKLKRFQVFKDNYQFVESFKNQPGLLYTVGLNKFADLSNEEFLQIYATYVNVDSSKATTSFRYASVTSIPASVDWRAKGAVTAIKDQAVCGACWAFTSVAAIEGINQIKTGTLISLSEQELVDCVKTSITDGCNGGNMDDAFKWVVKNGGITTEDNYPYTSGSTKTWGKCDTSKTKNYTVTIKGYEDVPAKNESALAIAVANQPVSVYIDANSTAFQMYSGGIFTGPCSSSSTDLNHAVTMVGYGSANGTNYWIAKNSWGTTWGESGFLRIKKDASQSAGLCGLAWGPSYPTK